jgi:hypothetical protein
VSAVKDKCRLIDTVINGPESFCSWILGIWWVAFRSVPLHRKQAGVLYMSESTNDSTKSAQKTREVEVQFTVKWVNFTYTVEEATSGVDAVDQALASYKQNGLKEFTITAGNEECSDLDDIFHVAEDFTKAADENGNDVVGLTKTRAERIRSVVS